MNYELGTILLNFELVVIKLFMRMGGVGPIWIMIYQLQWSLHERSSLHRIACERQEATFHNQLASGGSSYGIKGDRIMKVKIMIVIFTLMLHAASVWAGFTGPSTIIQGGWGSGDADFGFEPGDTMDSFPGLLLVDESGNIIIGDGVNFRVKIYDSAGNWQKNFSYKSITPIGGWPMNLKVKASVGILSIYEKLQKYDYNGNLIWSVALTGFQDFWITGDGGVWVQEYGKNEYNLYSPAGELLKSTTERPLELGKVKILATGANKNKYSITYTDKVYMVESANRFDRFIRDTVEYVNGIAKVDSGDEYWIYQVNKYSFCGKQIGELKLPVTRFEPSVVERQKYGIVERRRKVIEEFGEPVVAPNGDVYTWKRTPTTYSILKWTWQDDPNVKRCPEEKKKGRVMKRK